MIKSINTTKESNIKFHSMLKIPTSTQLAKDKKQGVPDKDTS